MARPKKHRRVCRLPDKNVIGNKDKKSGQPVTMTVDEFEIIRLIDYEGYTQQECAKQMQVARSTVTAVYDRARYNISDSLINDKMVKIDGGDFELCENSKTCCGQCGKNKCGRCRHGRCEHCIGIFHPAGKECYVGQ